MRVMGTCGAWGVAVVAALVGHAVVAEDPPVPRAPPVSGAVVSRVAGEQVRFVDAPSYRQLALGQDLLAGDVVVTGDQGLLGILFADRTVIRLHPNSTLLVRAVGAAAELELRAGTLWGRAERGGGGLVVRTPTAAAAIRGTDWALTAEGDGTARLSVYDGQVELSNAQGAILAEAGEHAVARPGQVPTKVLVANRREAEQMLFALDPVQAARPIGLSVDDGSVGSSTPAGLARFRRGIDALRRARYGQAAAALGDTTGLDAERVAAARWMAAYARIGLGEPFVAPAPTGMSADLLGSAFRAAIAGDLAGAAAGLAAAPQTAPTLAARIQVAILRDDTAGAEAALAELLARFPERAEAFESRARVTAAIYGDAEAAVPLWEAAVARDPDSPDYWNDLGLARGDADDPVGAEAALRQALALAPGDPVAGANLATLLVQQNRVAEARSHVAAAVARDPGGYLALRGAGTLSLVEGDADAAQAQILRALAAQPAAAETSILLAVAALQAGDPVRAGQELDAAARLDPFDPVVADIRAIVALDDARADDAIRQARIADDLRRGGRRAAAPISSDRRRGTTLSDAYGTIALDDWAREAADRSFDPLNAGSHFTEALLVRPDALDATVDATDEALPSALVQGLLLEPLAAASRLGRSDILRQPFDDVALTAEAGWGEADGGCGTAVAQGFRNAPAPLAYALTLSGCEAEGPRDRLRSANPPACALGCRATSTDPSRRPVASTPRGPSASQPDRVRA